MNFEELVNKRFSCRNFSDKQVEKEKVEKIIGLSNLAPSACNSQPYKIYVTRKETAKKISQARSLNMNGFIEKADTIFVIEEEVYNLTAKVGSKLKDQDYRSVDIGILSSYITLAAQELGLATCIIGMFDEEKIKNILGAKGRIRLLIAMGYSNTLKTPDKKRKDIEKVWKELD